MRGQARIADPLEHLGGGEPEDGEPGEPLAPGAARAFVVGPGGLLGARGAFLGADPECTDDLSSEAWMVLEVTADLPFNGASLMIAGTPATAGIGEFATLFDALEAGFCPTRWGRGGAARRRGWWPLCGPVCPTTRLRQAGRVSRSSVRAGTRRASSSVMAWESFPPLWLTAKSAPPLEQPVDGALFGGVGAGGRGDGNQRAPRALATTALMMSGLAPAAAPQPRRFRSRSSQSPMNWL